MELGMTWELALLLGFVAGLVTAGSGVLFFRASMERHLTLGADLYRAGKMGLSARAKNHAAVVAEVGVEQDAEQTLGHDEAMRLLEQAKARARTKNVATVDGNMYLAQQAEVD